MSKQVLTIHACMQVSYCSSLLFLSVFTDNLWRLSWLAYLYKFWWSPLHLVLQHYHQRVWVSVYVMDHICTLLWYNRTSIIWTPVFQLNQKSVQITEFVQKMKPIHLYSVVFNYSNIIVHLLYHPMTKYSNRVITILFRSYCVQ